MIPAFLRGFKLVHKAKKVHLNGIHMLDYEETKKLAAQLSIIPDGTFLRVEISVYDDRAENERLRTEQQNKYYHKLLDILAEHTGDDHMSLHEQLKFMFLSRPYVYKDKEYTIVKSTRELTSRNFGEYLEKIFHWASEFHGLKLPDSSKFYEIG